MGIVLWIVLIALIIAIAKGMSEDGGRLAVIGDIAEPIARFFAFLCRGLATFLKTIMLKIKGFFSRHHRAHTVFPHEKS